MSSSKRVFATRVFLPRVFEPGAFRGLGTEVVVLNELYDVTITQQRVTKCTITQQRVTDCTITVTG
jgi:hypothetical protein